MKKKIFLFASKDFDKKYINGISRLYQIFCREHNFNLEIIDEDFLLNNKPDETHKEIIAVAGGDGTIHRVINAIPDEYFAGYKFGLIPAGTANEFAKSLNLSLFLEEAATLIANENRRNKILHKVAVVQDKYKFLTGLMYGVACQVLQSTSPSAKFFWGAFAYNIPGVMSLSNFYDHIKNFKIDSLEFQTGYLIINNASLVSKDLTIEDIKDENPDLFSFIYVYPDVTPSDLLWLLLKNQARLSLLQDSSIYYTQLEEITLEFEDKTVFMLDGELYELASPLNIKHYEKCMEIIWK